VVERHARMLGTVILAIGLAVLISFGYYATGSLGEFRKAQLVHQRNPGNAMYDLQYFVAASQLVFVIGGAVCGALLALNGVTWLVLGSVARRLQPSAEPRRGGGA
jgi:hypothetical protein